MKRQIIGVIALVLIIAAIALMRSDSSAQAQRNRIYLYDSGVVQPGPNQMLIGLLVPSALVQNENIPVQVTKMQYAQVSCNGSFCQDIKVSELNIDASLDSDVVLRDSASQLPSSSGVRLVFSSRSPNLRANWQIIDTVSGAVVSTFSFGASQVGN
jgi:hypothetical protein